MIDCVEQFCTWWGWWWGVGGQALLWGAVVTAPPALSPAEASQQVVCLSDELARKAEDTVRQQEEISQLLAQVVDLQQKCRAVRAPSPSPPCPLPCATGGAQGEAP